uniref:Methyltransferase type 11 domain-containing protein n=1 Tax=Odontella aurita TaxID=265563 RepID=A0A6U6CHS1_9STRA|mmetsp:Transcript_1330/g.3655  ORF Transcript_1330/g.3655 Transcript_1330/m.3655 type:complete len:314 (+) Transcript_1330:614-1555(+)
MRLGLSAQHTVISTFQWLSMRFLSHHQCTHLALIDTTMCYPDGHATTIKLFAELHRVLKPGGRLITVSLHSEDEVVRYRFSPAVSHCRLLNRKKSSAPDDAKPQYHAMAVFDKLDGTSIDDKIRILDQHPIDIVGAAPDVEDEVERIKAELARRLRQGRQSSDLTPALERLSVSTESNNGGGQQQQQHPPQRQHSDNGRSYGNLTNVNPKEEETLESAENIAQLMTTVDTVLEDLMNLHDKAKALARERAKEERSKAAMDRSCSPPLVSGGGEDMLADGEGNSSVKVGSESDGEDESAQAEDAQASGKVLPAV